MLGRKIKMNKSKIIYWKIYVDKKFFGRYTTNEARIAALKKLKNKKIDPRQIEIKLCFGNLEKI